MNTKLATVSDAPAAIRRPRRSISPAKRTPGRPARPWLKPRIRVPHPLQPHQDAHITQEQAAAWTYRSPATVARWAEAGECPDKALAALLGLYAHGLPAIPPDALQEPGAARWLAFRFAPDRSHPKRAWALWTPCSGHGLSWALVDDLHASRRRWESVAVDLERWRARALKAEAEAARLRDLVAYAA